MRAGIRICLRRRRLRGFRSLRRGFRRFRRFFRGRLRDDRRGRLRRLRLGRMDRDHGRHRSGRLLRRSCAPVLDLHIERRAQNAEKQRSQQAVGQIEHEAHDLKQHAEVRDRTEQRQHRDPHDPCADRQHVRAEHLALVAHGLGLRDLDGLSELHIVARHEDIGREPVFIRPDDAEDDADDRDQRPQEDPQIHPRHAAEHVPDELLAERGKQIGRLRLQPGAVGVEVDHRHRSVQQQRRAERDRRDPDKAGLRRKQQDPRQQRQPPEPERPLHQNGK